MWPRSVSSVGSPSCRLVPLRTSATAAFSPQRLVPVRHSGSLSTQGGERSEQARPEDFDTRQLYKDCIRLSHHIAARSPKGEAMRSMIRQQFKSNMGETDPTKINELKMRAISGIQNYVIHENTRKALSKKGKEYASSFDAGSGGGSSGSSGSSSGAS